MAFDIFTRKSTPANWSRGGAATPPTPAPAPTPKSTKQESKIFAYIYRKPNEVSCTMAFGPANAKPREMGIFDNLDVAQSVARDKGWTLAWKGARDT